MARVSNSMSMTMGVKAIAVGKRRARRVARMMERRRWRWWKWEREGE
jgi:hypothetical protein